MSVVFRNNTNDMEDNTMKVYSSREFIAILKKNGFMFVRQSGGHKVFRRGNQQTIVNRKINRMIVERVIKEFELVL